MQTLMPNFPLFTTPLSFFITLAAICVPLGVFLLYKAFTLPDKKEEEDFKRATKYGVREYESYKIKTAHPFEYAASPTLLSTRFRPSLPNQYIPAYDHFH